MLWPLAVLLFAGPAAGADGKFFPRVDLADPPGIVAQRALLDWRDGTETLIIQSDLADTGDAIAWLLPLPNPPTSIDAAPANTLTGLRSVVAPRIVRVATPAIALGFVLAVLIIVASLHRIAVGRPEPRLTLTGVLGLVVVFAAAAVVLLPSLERAGLRSGVTILDSVRAGVYDITIIAGREPAAVEGWLTDNGFEASDATRAIIRDYVERDWCFLAARLAPDAGEEVTQHPLKLTFPAAEPIYPMRLTGADGDPVTLDLFVLGEMRAAVDGLTTWCSATYRETAYSAGFFGRTGAEVQTTVFAGQGQVGLPAITDLMWNGCVLTRLHGRLSPAQMRDDLAVTWHAPRDMRARVVPRDTALTLSGLLAAGVFAILLATCVNPALQRRWTLLHVARRRGPLLLLVSFAAAAACYASFDVVAVQPGLRYTPAAQQQMSSHAAALAMLHDDPPVDPFPEAYARALSEIAPDDPPRRTDDPYAPGDYRIEAGSGGWTLTIIDWRLIAITIDIEQGGGAP